MGPVCNYCLWNCVVHLLALFRLQVLIQIFVFVDAVNNLNFLWSRSMLATAVLDSFSKASLPPTSQKRTSVSFSLSKL